MRSPHTLFALAASATLAAHAQAQFQYDVIDFGTIGGQSVANDVNDTGQVVGTHSIGFGDDAPFLWKDGVMTMLPVPPGSGRATANRISETGRVVGWATASGVFLPRPLVWDQNQFADIGTLGGVDGGAIGISPDGSHVVGWARPDMGTILSAIGFRAFDWDGFTMSDLGTLPVGHWSQSSDANDAGQVIGMSGSKNDSSQATLFDPDQGAIELGTLGGLAASAAAINASGQIVGRSETGLAMNIALNVDRLVEHAFLWDQGVMTDLGALPGDIVSWGLDLNDAGVAVGTSIDVFASPWNWRAWIWENGQLQDLNDLIDPASGWTLEWANAINNNGWIVGRGRLNGQVRGFLLKPTP
jgi:probable HAF family extracellular repeat protein